MSNQEAKTDTDATVSCSEIISSYLKAQGYDGLVDCNGECACVLEDLMPCGGDSVMDCQAGYEVECTCEEGCAFHIKTGKKAI